MSLVMNLLAGLASLVVALSWAWFLLFPLVVVLVGLHQVTRGVVRGYQESGVPGALDGIRQVLCPTTHEQYAVQVAMVGGQLQVTRCPRFGTGPVTCAQGCLSQG